MELPLSDLIDRYSIELRKDYYGFGNRPMILDLAAEIRTKLRTHIPRMVRYDGGDVDADMAFAIVRGAVLLGLRNADIANCEFQIRRGDKLSLEEIGKRALLTRKLNDARSDAKQAMSAALGENVETRHFGFGNSILTENREPVAYDGITFDVQEPVDGNNQPAPVKE